MLSIPPAPINTLIVDDEPNWLTVLGKLVQLTPYLNLVGTCRSAMEAYGQLAEKEIDLLICDIEMPDISGLSFIRSLRTPPLVIFVTAHATHALDSYEVSPVDFLLKPIDPARFLASIEKVRTRRQHQPDTPATEPYFLVRDSQQYVQIAYRDVLYVEAQENFLRIVTPTQTIVPTLSLSRFLDQIKSESLLRVHRSFVVNRAAISRIGKNDLTLSSGHSIPIGDQYRAQLNRKHIESNLISRQL
jgi:DNA-binding LytR/AlgR family response regulator